MKTNELILFTVLSMLLISYFGFLIVGNRSGSIDTIQESVFLSMLLFITIFGLIIGSFGYYDEEGRKYDGYI
jgi:ABC-type Na+ efflux pump permease subunit